MNLFTNGIVHAPDGTRARGVVVEIGLHSVAVRSNGAVAWFVWPPEMDGRLKLHGTHGEHASWFEHGKGNGRG